MEPLKDSTSTTPERLVLAVLQQWQAHGSGGISARQISGLADIPVSSIYHHFGSLEHLLAAAQDTALRRTEDWCQRQIAALSHAPAVPAAFAAFFAGVIDDWCENERTLAFAWREGDLLADTSPVLHERARLWQGVWSRFWEQACQHFAIPRSHVIAQRIFESESLFHLIRWQRTIDRAALHEVAQVLCSWLTGAPTAITPWRDHARAVALATMPLLPDRDEASARIALSAAQLLSETGSTQLTHRLVAEHAGVTLGTVSHKFRTKSDLLEAAFEGVYTAVIERMVARVPSPPGGSDATLDAFATSIHRTARERARNELFLAVAREPNLERFGCQLRYLRGRSAQGMLQALLGGEYQPSTAEAALFSAFGLAQIRLHSLDLAQGGVEQVRAEYRELLDMIALR